MTLRRREFLSLAAAAAALPAAPCITRAQSYPTRPVRLVVPGAAGNTVDILARVIGQWLSERLGQPFMIENRPGAGTNIGTEAVVRSPADGYTLLLIAPGNVINPTIYDKLNFNFIRDIAPIAIIFRTANVIVANPSFSAKSVPEFIAYAKANPGKLNYGSGGIGTGVHVSTELFKMMAGVDLVHVPYRGGVLLLADLISGQLQVTFDYLATSIEYIRTGKLRALAVTSEARSELLPEIPTVGEFLPGYEASFVLGIGTPNNTPTEIIDKLNREINVALGHPKIKARLAELGGEVVPLSPADFGKLLTDDVAKWGKVVKFAGIKAD